MDAELTLNKKNKYAKDEKLYSIDGGATWLSYNPPIYRQGNLLEFESNDCLEMNQFPGGPEIKV